MVILNDYVEQPQGFVNPELKTHVFMLKKVLCSLRQAPKAWYEYLTGRLVTQGYSRDGVDKTFFVKYSEGHVVVA